MKKMVALLLTAALLVSLTGAVAEGEKTIVTFWHHRGSGTQYECVSHAVETFNATVGAEKGIEVQESYIGGYDDLFAKTQLSVQSGDAPDVTVMANTYVGSAIDDGYVVDMAPLAAEDGFDTANFLTCFSEIYGNTDGTLYSVPYCRSTPLLYYNKTMADELGITLGNQVTIDELAAFGRAAYQADSTGAVTRYGFELLNDFGYYNGAWIYQLGSEYISENGGSASLEDGTMLKVLTDWRGWVDEGWCRSFDATNAGDTMLQMFYAGQLGSFVGSSASLATVEKGCADAGVELGVAMFPTYDVNHDVAMIGGSNLCVIGEGKSDEQVRASWEFIKFLMSDEEVYFNAKTSGYLPVTQTVSNYADMVSFWNEKPEFRVAYDQLLNYGKCQETPYVPAGQDFTQIVWDNMSLMIQEGSITPEEAVANITAESANLW